MSLFVYLHDMQIYSTDPQQHISHVRAVLHHLLENQLFVKAEKCEFCVSSVTIVGFIFESGQVWTDPDKIKAVAEWPVPEDQKQLQWSLGLPTFTDSS